MYLEKLIAKVFEETEVYCECIVSKQVRAYAYLLGNLNMIFTNIHGSFARMCTDLSCTRMIGSVSHVKHNCTSTNFQWRSQAFVLQSSPSYRY